MRVVGVDLGTRRVGVAVSDDGGRLATAHTVLERTGDDDADRVSLAAVISALEPDAVVVGLPLSLDGTVGVAARWAQVEAERLAAVLDVPLHLHDERLSTVTASRHPLAGLAPAGQGRERRRRQHRPATRRPVDATAAAVMLQSWLDGRREQQ